MKKKAVVFLVIIMCCCLSQARPRPFGFTYPSHLVGTWYIDRPTQNESISIKLESFQYFQHPLMLPHVGIQSNHYVSYMTYDGYFGDYELTIIRDGEKMVFSGVLILVSHDKGYWNGLYFCVEKTFDELVAGFTYIEGEIKSIKQIDLKAKLKISYATKNSRLIWHDFDYFREKGRLFSKEHYESTLNRTSNHVSSVTVADPSQVTESTEQPIVMVETVATPEPTALSTEMLEAPERTTPSSKPETLIFRKVEL